MIWDSSTEWPDIKTLNSGSLGQPFNCIDTIRLQKPSEARSGVFVVSMIKIVIDFVLLVVEVLPRLRISSGQYHIRCHNVMVSTDDSHCRNHQKDGPNITPIARVALQNCPQTAKGKVELSRGHYYWVG